MARCVKSFKQVVVERIRKEGSTTLSEPVPDDFKALLEKIK